MSSFCGRDNFSSLLPNFGWCFGRAEELRQKGGGNGRSLRMMTKKVRDKATQSRRMLSRKPACLRALPPAFLGVLLENTPVTLTDRAFLRTEQ